MTKILTLFEHIKSIYSERPIPLHRPIFTEAEEQICLETLKSNFVSTAGAQVSNFENALERFTGFNFAVVTVSGTSALHLALLAAGVKKNDEVLTQALTFVATCNSISYVGAMPVFIDVDKDTLGLSPSRLDQFLSKNAKKMGGICINRNTNRRIKACMPMHTFGNIGRIGELKELCDAWNVRLIEDSAEALGSFYNSSHAGKFSDVTALSFNGNKIVTTGGGGAVLTDDEAIAKKVRHLSTTAKLKHKFEYIHDEIGYNYRMPAINAALGLAQMAKLQQFLAIKKDVANSYQEKCTKLGIRFFSPPNNCSPNHWLNALVLDSAKDKMIFFCKQMNRY